MLYQIFTEDINRPEITRILDAHFQGYTLVPASGHWQGLSEPSIVAEIETDDSKAIQATAQAIRQANKQQAVLVEAIQSTAQLVTDTEVSHG